MAFPTTLLIASFALCLLAASKPATAQRPIELSGRLLCTPTGNFNRTLCVDPSSCLGLAGVNVLISCDGGRTVIRDILTNPNGFFNTTLRVVNSVLFRTSQCVAFVRLPVANCSVLPPTGLLASALAPIGLIPSLLGLVLQLVPQVFQIVSNLNLI